MTADSDHSSDFERACDAFWLAWENDDQFPRHLDQVHPNTARSMRRGMLAALRALREPSEDHLEAVWPKSPEYRGQLLADWQAMLDELIRQGEARQPGD